MTCGNTPFNAPAGRVVARVWLNADDEGHGTASRRPAPFRLLHSSQTSRPLDQTPNSDVVSRYVQLVTVPSSPPIPPYRLGFSDQLNEISVDDLPVSGQVPDWLTGDLLRNGPAMWTVGPRRMNHWFDGMAMLHRFTIDHGSVSYANKFLRSPDYKKAADGKISYREFATDPCRSFFKSLISMFGSIDGGNANVNISKVADEFVAMTETPMLIGFDSKTLDTLGVVDYADAIKGQVTTAHPHFDHQRNASVNYIIAMGVRSSYNVFSLPSGSKTRNSIAVVPVTAPSYMHSFAMSERFVVLMEYPLVVNPIALKLSGKPFIENYKWKPELGTTFIVVDKENGAVQKIHTREAWFSFHHVNAFENGNQLHLDVSAYANSDIISDLSLHSRIDAVSPQLLVPPVLRRFTLDLAAGTVVTRQLSEQPIELPRINYGKNNARDYQFAYGLGVDPITSASFLDRIVKIAVSTGESTVWKQTNAFPGEAVFVASPEAAAEDDGVLLSVVLDGESGTSFLLILDASNLTELARVVVPQAVPFGFHGQFVQSP